MNTATLLCSCTDRSGIVAALTHFVAEYGGNVIDLDQHTDSETNQFFMRLVWDLRNSALSRDDLPGAMGIVAKKFHNMHWSISFSTPLPRVAVLVSKTQHCLADLLLRHQMGEMPGEMALVVGNHGDLADLARHFGVPFAHIPATRDNKEQAELEQRALLRERGIDLVVLARYMQVLGPEFVNEWTGRIINIHHSFLPAFVGAKPYHQAKARGVKLIGATAHYVTAELDQGPIITQGVTTVSHRDEVEDLIRKGRDIERQVLAQAVRLHLERRVIVAGNRTLVFQ
ncbi:MAG: formyltetrahydrofolate deformylase [Planctomycetota bacterium]|jgi:formyltetrahydrofolate deformylase|nr:formyltetrahydrofolate deformylase [Planctomycetota bacterium]